MLLPNCGKLIHENYWTHVHYGEYNNHAINYIVCIMQISICANCMQCASNL